MRAQQFLCGEPCAKMAVSRAQSMPGVVGARCNICTVLSGSAPIHFVVFNILLMLLGG